MSRVPEFTIPFGKYKGESINNVPTSYIDWLVREQEERKDWTLNHEEFFEKLMEYIGNENIQQEISRDFDNAPEPESEDFDE